MKLQILKVKSFITNLDEQAKVIRGGDIDPDWTLKFCPSTNSFVNCKTK